jgi:hypothetical protein
MSKSSDVGAIGGLFWLLLVIFLVVGEIKCIVKFFDSDFEPSYKREAIYGFSAIGGIGCVVGWMDFPDTPPTK